MSRYSFIADIHVDNFARWGGALRAGVNDRARAVLATLDRAVSLAQTSAALVVAGDLFNRSRPEPALLAHVQDVLLQHPRVIMLVGNHDQESTEYGHHALSPFSAHFEVIEQPTVIEDLWLIPFQAGKAADWLPAAIEHCASQAPAQRQFTALCLHLGISDEGTPYYLDATAGSINVKTLAELCKRHNVTHVFAGDWHRHQVWKTNDVTLVQIGALAPPRFPPGYEHGDKGPLVHWDGPRVEVVDVPGPRFHKQRWSGLDQSWRPRGTPAFFKLTYRSDQEAEAKAWVELVRKELGDALAGVEFDVDRGIEQAKLKTASFEVRQASSHDEAAARYVQIMPVEPGVRRDVVLTHVRRFLGK